MDLLKISDFELFAPSSLLSKTKKRPRRGNNIKKILIFGFSRQLDVQAARAIEVRLLGCTWWKEKQPILHAVLWLIHTHIRKTETAGPMDLQSESGYIKTYTHIPITEQPGPMDLGC